MLKILTIGRKFTPMKIAIIGAGAAGCFAAANIANSSGVELAVFEKTGKALQKVKVSGGGRCNVTHHLYDVPSLLEKYPRGKALLKKTLYQFGPSDTVAWFEKRGVRIKAEADGRMFPTTDDSQTIIDCLWQAMMRNKVNVFYHKNLKKITPINDNQLRLLFDDGSQYDADAVVLSMGGNHKPEQNKWLADMGHTIAPSLPSLFTFNMPGNDITQLMGVTVADVTVKIAGTKWTQQGPLLITHWGMSGPAILKTSAYAAKDLAACNYHFNILINWLGNTTDEELKELLVQQRQQHGSTTVKQRNPTTLPKRLWDYLTTKCDINENMKWGELTASAQRKLIEHLLRHNHQVKGKTTFKEEFVTCGGVALSDIDANTMESKKVKGLYLAGELIDVDGVTGGFNFQHAWSSGYAAAKAISKLIEERNNNKIENTKPD